MARRARRNAHADMPIAIAVIIVASVLHRVTFGRSPKSPRLPRRETVSFKSGGVGAEEVDLEGLESSLRCFVETSGADRTHDIDHVTRVWKTCETIVALDYLSVDRRVLMAAAYLHDVVSLLKDSPLRAQGSRMAAEVAASLLRKIGIPELKIPLVEHAVISHSHSAGVAPRTVEAKVLQDADRVDALGAIGLARTFYAGGEMRRRLFDPDDPLAERRRRDDGTYAVDHLLWKSLDAGRRYAHDKGEEDRRPPHGLHE